MISAPPAMPEYSVSHPALLPMISMTMQRRCMDAVDDFRGNIHSRVEAEGHVGAVNIVVDGLGQADDVQALLAEQVGRFMRAVSAQAQQAVQLRILIRFFHGGDFVDLVVLHDGHHFKRRALGAKDRAAHRQNAGKFILLHFAPFALDEAVVAVLNADDLHLIAETLVQRLGRAADGGVQAGTVPAGGD